MITLQPTQYNDIKSFFGGILGANWHLESLKNRNIGTVIVDKFPECDTVYIETPFFFYYFAGKYNKTFMECCINHIIKDLIPIGEKRPLFIFSSDIEWKKGIESYTKPHINKTFGAYLTRRLLHLNVKRYEELKNDFIVPDGYIFNIKNEDSGVCSVSLYDNVEVCRCNDGGRGLGYMDFDVFTHSEHRNQGLAFKCCSMLINYCLDNDIMPQWGCWTVNVPSCKLAEKLGFELTSETQANFAEIKNDIKA